MTNGFCVEFKLLKWATIKATDYSATYSIVYDIGIAYTV